MKYFRFILLLFIFSSCERTITLKVNDLPPKLVVEASIENNQTVLVGLSSSLNFFSTITPDELSKSFVHNAKITLSNGTKTNLLKEYAVTDTSGFIFYYYTVDSADLANAIMQIVGQLPYRFDTSDCTATIFNYSNTGAINWHQFAIAIKELSGSNCIVNPIPSSQYPTPAKRPAYSVMDTSKIRQAFNIVIPGWKESLEKCLDLLKK